MNFLATRGSGVALACLLAAGLVPPSTALARDSLPWADANPLEPVGSGSRAGKPARKAVAAKTTAAASSQSVPAQPVPATVPVPEARPADEGPDKPVDDVAKAREPRPKPDEPAESAGSREPLPDDQSPDAVPTPIPRAKADAAKDLSATQIPVPEARPADDQIAAPAPAVEAPKPEATPGTAVPDDAPNSTEKLKSRQPDITPAASVAAAAAIEDAQACEGELKRRGVEFAVGESISEGDCGVLRPVAVTRLSSGVAVSPRTQMLCRAALALDDWMTGSVVPAAKTSFPGERVKEFQHASTYVCRPRASESGISEHARGSAIDIAAFVFDKGRTIGVEAQPPGTPEEAFQTAVRAGACGPFRTVLGPGTDADHATHFHLDIAARHNGATYCK